MGNKLNRWIFQIPLEDVQNILPFTKDKPNSEKCLLCGKTLKSNSKVFWVHLLTNGNLVSSDEEFDNSQGLFLIGSECKNKLPNNFYWDNNTIIRNT